MAFEILSAHGAPKSTDKGVVMCITTPSGSQAMVHMSRKQAQAYEEEQARLREASIDPCGVKPPHAYHRPIIIQQHLEKLIYRARRPEKRTLKFADIIRRKKRRGEPVQYNSMRPQYIYTDTHLFYGTVS